VPKFFYLWKVFSDSCENREDESATPRASTFVISTKKVRELGVDIEPLEDVMRELVESLKEIKALN
jgi:hypothetical protein